MNARDQVNDQSNNTNKTKSFMAIKCCDDTKKKSEKLLKSITSKQT